MIRNLLICCLTMLISDYVHSTPSWAGYINDLSSPGERYGYIEVSSGEDIGGYYKLRLTCYPPQGFRLYLDERHVGREVPSRVSIEIDALPMLEFQVYQHGRLYFLSDQSPDFWKLIAQMVAGSYLQLQLADFQQNKISLKGFTREFDGKCGWMTAADSYREFVKYYK